MLTPARRRLGRLVIQNFLLITGSGVGLVRPGLPLAAISYPIFANANYLLYARSVTGY